MLKMIIADDEPLITNGIKVLVDWEQLGINIIGEYQDGKSALYGIMTLRPEIAILDISMPGMTGIDILKELKSAGVTTRVIFLSGFQDFEFAREAIQYGVTEYLLKPVKKDSLIDAIWKCINYYKQIAAKQTLDNPLYMTNKLASQFSSYEEEKQEMPTEVYGQLVEVEQTTYIPVAVDIIGYRKKEAMEQKLVQFSVFGCIEDYLKENGCGIIFYQKEQICIIFKGQNKEDAYQSLTEIQKVIQTTTKHQMGFVMGACVSEMRMIPNAFRECVQKLPYFFFCQHLPNLILNSEKEVFHKKGDSQDLTENRNNIINQLFLRDENKLEAELNRFEKSVCNIADGNREIAIYQYLHCIRAIEEHFETMGIKEYADEMENLMEQVRKAHDYSELVDFFKTAVNHYFESLSLAVKNNDNKVIVIAKNYMEEHYSENISLTVLANYIHMNPIYFSTYFKKQTGENFKDYLNQVRMKHAVELLITTDVKSYEIAEKVGFRDSRYFVELFQRMYGKTPLAYRKELSK